MESEEINAPLLQKPTSSVKEVEAEEKYGEPQVDTSVMLEFIENDDQQLPPTPTLSPRRSQQMPKSTKLQKPTAKQADVGYTQITQVDKAKIVGYNLIEPSLVTVILGTTLQIAQLGTLIYTLVLMIVILPLLLTSNIDRITTKKWCTLAMVIIAPSITLMKSWIYCQFTNTEAVNDNVTLKELLGVWHDQWTKTFLNDIVIFVFSALLFWHYLSQVTDTNKRLIHHGTQKYQKEFYLLHFEFGKKNQLLFYSAYLFYFVDTIVYQSVVNLAILIILLGFLQLWAIAHQTSKELKEKMLRIMQVTSWFFVVISFSLRMPYILDGWLHNNQRLLQVFGLEALVTDSAQDYVWLSRSHRFILSFAITISEAFFVCNQINVVKAIYVSQEDPIVITRSQSPLYNRSSEFGGESSGISFDLTPQAHSTTEIDVKPLLIAKKGKKPSFLEIIKLPLWLWVCRIICFIQVYRFHDVQSVIPLVWLLHSFMWTNRPLEPEETRPLSKDKDKDPDPHPLVSSVVDPYYIKITCYVYLPLMYLCYLWYFIINIFGLINYGEFDVNGKSYELGFYEFTNPELELPICLSSILAIAIYTRFSLLTEAPKSSFMGYLRKYSPTVHSVYYLILLAVQILVWTYSVIFSLVVMDLFHICVLFVMIIAQFKSKLYNDNIWWLLVYANFYVLAKYVYSLTPSKYQTNVWAIVIGISSQNYEPDSLEEYWRYDPPTAAWFFVLAVSIQYHRNKSIIMDEAVIEQATKKAMDRIDMKSPLIQSIKKVFVLVMNHLIVMLTFALFLMTVFLTRRTFMNGITLILTLSLLGIYMNHGISQLTKYWRILQIYQAFVLASVIFIQFLAYLSQTQFEKTGETNFLMETWENHTDYEKALWHYAGFYQFTDPVWRKFLPLVFLFFFSIIVEKNFKTKMEMENEKNVIKEVEPKIEESDLNFEEPQFLGSLEDSKLLQITEAEQLKYKQKYDAMQYKISYLLWKMKPIWPVFTFISLGFQYILFSFIMGCALYYSIAVIWFIWLIIFMLQTWYNQRTHMWYQKAQVLRFSETTFDFEDGQGRDLPSANEIRHDKLLVKQNSPDVRGNQDLERQIKQAEMCRELGEKRMRMTDEEAIEEYRKYDEEIGAVTVEAREFYWSAQFAILVIANIMLYFSTFIVTPTTAENPATLVPESHRSQVLFIFFFSGFYSDSNVSYLTETIENSANYWPFFTLLLLLVIEKWCQQWIKNRFGADKPGIDKEFTDIENQYNELKEEKIKQKKIEELINQPVEPQLQRRETYNPNSVSQKKKREALMQQLYPLLTIKYKLKIDLSSKIIIQEVAIMLVFISLIYKQNIFSFVLFVVLVYYTIQKFRNANPMLLVRYTVVTVILLEYLLALTNLSSYNSPSNFPGELTRRDNPGEGENVYPNPDQLYYTIPWYFNVTQLSYNDTLTVPSGVELPEINVAMFQFFGVCVSGHQLNGLWIDFTVVMLMYFYLNNYSIWVIKKEFKIVRSARTIALLMEYQALTKNVGLGEIEEMDEIEARELAKSLQNEQSMIRFFHFSSENLYSNFALIMILFLMLTSIFSHNFIALGYFIFSMVLIYNYRNFFKESEARDNQIIILKYFLLPYLLLDIFAQLCTQIPFTDTPQTLEWTKFIGFVQVWTYTPAYLYLGEDVKVSDQVSSSTSLTILFLKAVVYFVVLVQLDTVLSSQFLKFYDNVLFENLKHVELIGKGLAYRFNNFKIKKLKKQSGNYSKLDKMLKEVKAVVKRRNLWRKSGQEHLTQVLVSKAKHQVDPIVESPIPLLLIEQSAFDETEIVRIQNKIDFRKQYKTEWNHAYEERLKKLNFMFKLYLWVRRNYVQDILFKHSQEHLEDIVSQYREGRTNIRTQIELGIMIDIKKTWLDAKYEEFKIKRELGEISEEQFTDYQEYRRKLILSFELKPWERYNPDTYLSWHKLLNYWVVVIYKVFSSNMQVLSFIFMILAVIMNGGALYMIYPALVFGVAMVEEERPGKFYWYFVIFYTQLLIFLQYMAQLSVWSTSTGGQTDFGDRILLWMTNHNMGIIQIQNVEDHYRELFLLIFPELLILITVLIHIQKETMAGIFNFSLSSHETFRDGLIREEQNLLQKDKQFKSQFKTQSIATRQLLENGLEYNLLKRKYSSVQDRLEIYHDEAKMVTPDGLSETNMRQTVDLDSFTIQDLMKGPLKVDMSFVRTRSHSADLTMSKTSFAQTNLLKIVGSKIVKMTDFLWDSEFFERLFPRCKQQKPGYDLYVGIACTSIVIIIYLILAFTQMSGQKMTSISQQFSNNQFSGNMVLSMFIMICIMVIDRYFYSSQSFLSRKDVAKKLNTDSPLAESSQGKSTSAPSQGKSQEDQSQGTSEDAQSVLNPSALVSVVESNDIANDTEKEDSNIAFQDWLIPQFIPKAPTRVLRFYFLWFVLILGHWFIFFYLTDEQSVCATTPYCNTFYKNTYLIFFYIIFCIYLALCATQIRYGLPELKKGGFLQERYDPVSKITYQSWYYTPFLFELRTIIDWTFTTTSLDVFQAVSVAQIQSDLYIAKCYNKPYMEKPLGQKISVFLKIAEGFSLMMFIIVLIAGPMLLFSSINPVGQTNPVSDGDLAFYINLGDPQQGTNLTVNLFITTSLTKNQTITSEQFNAMNFNSAVSQSDQFTSSQTQALQFSPISDNVWGITYPKKQILLSALQDILDNPDTNNTATAVLQSNYKRDTATSVTAIYQTDFQLTFVNQTVLTQLIQTIACNSSSTDNLVVFPDTVYSAIQLNQKSAVLPLVQQTPVQSGFTLHYTCSLETISEDYWTLEQDWNQNSPLYDEETSIFVRQNGFGVFVFNQDVLPNFLSSYASSVIFFYVAIVYVIASTFRSAFVPLTQEIFIINATLTDTILKICQCIYIYRVQRNLENEEELYHILLEIMRSPETIKQMCGTSLKKKLE